MFDPSLKGAPGSNDPGSPLDLPASEVLRHYPIILPNAAPVALANCGGFSGARLWQVEGTNGAYCLRAWPSGDPVPDRLSWIHELMQRARGTGLDFVPALARTTQGATWIAHAGRLWDLVTWMPGRADFQDKPTSGRLKAACTALARLHGAWVDVAPAFGPCPGIERRLAIADDWIRMVQSGWHPPFAVNASDPVHPWAERAWYLLRHMIEDVPRVLASWRDCCLTLQPCLCDIWHEHVLFDGDVVTGLIDYGSVKVDHVAVDLARLLGSMAGNDTDLRRAGLRAYLRWRPLTWEEEALVDVLDETGTVIAAANWLKWLYRDGRIFADRSDVARRLAKLVERLEEGKRSVVRSQPAADYGLRTTD